MENLAAIAAVLISFLGMLLIAGAKIPELAKANPEDFKKKPSFVAKARPAIDDFLERTRKISFYGMLHKLLSKIKILSLKMEKITDTWLRKIRQKTTEKEESDS